MTTDTARSRTKNLVWIGLATLTVLIGISLLIVFGGSKEAPFVPPAGSLATTSQEQSLLDMHMAMGTLAEHGEEAKQSAILEAARTLCRQLDDGTTTPALWTAIAAKQGVPNANVYTDFAIQAMCPQHEHK